MQPCEHELQDIITSFYTDYFNWIVGILFGTVIVALVDLCDVFCKMKCFFRRRKKKKDYCVCSEPCPGNQSPININILSVCNIDSDAFLFWSSRYKMTPKSIVMKNDGRTVVLTFCWPDKKRPVLSGGPLATFYELEEFQFRWGANDQEGSEHTINFVRYPLELQALYYSHQFCCMQDALKSNECFSILIVSYFFQFTESANAFLEPITQNLEYIKCPQTQRCITPFPLACLAPAFVKEYYVYMGSLTFPPYKDEVLWIIQPKPLGISIYQNHKFRELIGSCKTPLLSNCRPMQLLNRREIVYYS